MKKAFVNSLPKSGTNLLAKCLLLFGYKERAHLSAGSVLDKKPRSLMRRILWRPASKNYLIGINSPIEVRRSPIDSILRKVKEGEFLTAHVGYRSDLLESVLELGFTPIQVIRDPRAVLASFVPYVLKDGGHFLHNTFKRLPHFERFEVVLDGISVNGTALAPLRTCCLALDPWVNSEKVICIKFEEIVGAQGGGSDRKRVQVLEQLASRLGLPKDHIPQVSDNLYGPGRHTFRKGKIDSWRDEILVELLEPIAQELGEILDRWGYSK